MSRMIRLTCVLLVLISSCMAQKKKRVAVMDFDYGTVQSYVAGIYGTNQDVGKGISDLLVEKLVKDGKYKVIERKALDKILAEQNFSNSDRADASTAAKIGRVLGVDAIIIGSVTKFGRDDHSVGGGAVGAVTGHFGLGGARKNDAKAVCGISARMVDTSTGEILAAVSGDGKSKRSGVALAGVGAGHGGLGGATFDTHSSNFGDTLMGEAVIQAVDQVGAKLDDSATNVPARKAEFSGVVADVSGNTIILNVGAKKGVQVGDKVQISRPVRTVKDPTTGKVIKVITNKIGEATVTEVDSDSATATFEGSGSAKVGDTAKTPGS